MSAAGPRELAKNVAQDFHTEVVAHLELRRGEAADPATPSLGASSLPLRLAVRFAMLKG